MGKRTGLVLANIYQGASRAMWRLASMLSEEHPDEALLLFPGGRIGYPGGSEYLRNSIYDLVDRSSLDGAIVWSSSLTGAEDTESISGFVKGLSEHLPVVSMCMAVPGIPSVDFDAYSGMYAAVMHFIKRHGARRIAFLRGPENHGSAEARYQAYLDALSDSLLPFDAGLVSSPRPWSEGEEAMNELMRRGLVPGESYDCIVAASDLLILGADTVLRSHGISVPGTVGIAAFNDNEENHLLDVGLTTVRMPIQRLLEASYSLVRAMEDEGGALFSDIILPAPLVVRSSCGCRDSFGGADRAREEIKDRESFLRWLRSRTDDGKLFSHAAAMLRFLYGEGMDEADVIESASAYFDAHGEAEVIMEAMKWAEMLLLHEAPAEKRDFLISRILHEEKRLYAREREKIGNETRVLDSFKTGLLAARSHSVIPSLMYSLFPSLGITSSVIVLYRDFSYSEMLGGFSGGKIFSESVTFPRRELLPESFSYVTEKGTFVVEPLFYDSQELGYIVIGTSWCEAHVLEDIRASVSSALKGISLLDIAEKAAEAAEEGERKAGEFYAGVSEALRGPLSEMHRILSGGGRFPRKEMAEAVTKAEHMLSLSLAEFGELDMDKALVPLSELVSKLENEGADVECSGELPSVEMDTDLAAELLLVVSEAVSAAQPHITVTLTPSSVLFRIAGDGKIKKERPDSALRYAAKIAALHSGDMAFDGSDALFRLPYPVLSGHPSVTVPDGTVLWLSDDAVPSSLLSLPVEKADAGSFAHLLHHMNPRPSAVAWRRGKGLSGTELFSLLKGHRFARTLPVMLFGFSGREISLPVALECDRSAAEEVLILSSERIPQLDLIFSGAGRIEEGLPVEEMLSAEGQVRLIVLHEAEGMLSAVRHSRRFASCPVLIVKDAFSSADVADIAGVPNVIIVNSALLDAPDFVARLLAIAGGESPLPPLTGALVKRAIAYMNRHMTRQVTRWQIAESVNISEDYLTRIFRREMGVSPWDYLNRCRVGLACSLLLGTGASMSEIADESGFHDQAYFCRVFRRIKGMSPGQYRQRL